MADDAEERDRARAKFLISSRIACVLAYLDLTATREQIAGFCGVTPEQLAIIVSGNVLSVDLETLERVHTEICTLDRSTRH